MGTWRCTFFSALWSMANLHMYKTWAPGDSGTAASSSCSGCPDRIVATHAA